MPVFFDMLENEENPAVRVVLGHFVFVYIHPYLDGNGRIGRFLVNVMLASGGYPWTVGPLDSREDYMSSLEAASVDQDIIRSPNSLQNWSSTNWRGKPLRSYPRRTPKMTSANNRS